MRLCFLFSLFSSSNDGKSCFSVKKLISTSERCVEHPFAGQNTQQIPHCCILFEWERKSISLLKLTNFPKTVSFQTLTISQITVFFPRQNVHLKNSLCQKAGAFLSLNLSCVFVCVSGLFVCSLNCLFLFCVLDSGFFSLSLSLSLSFCLSFCLFLSFCLSLSVSLFLSLYFCLSFPVSVFLSLSFMFPWDATSFFQRLLKAPPANPRTNTFSDIFEHISCPLSGLYYNTDKCRFED